MRVKVGQVCEGYIGCGSWEGCWKSRWLFVRLEEDETGVTNQCGKKMFEVGIAHDDVYHVLHARYELSSELAATNRQPQIMYTSDLSRIP
jgi:hypothetical protein